MPSKELLEETQDIALSILEEARLSLMAALRFMDVALWNMPFEVRYMTESLGSDGAHLFYDPVSIIWQYKKSPNEIARNYLHTIMHCVYLHPFDNRHPNVALWNLACDIAVEATVLDLCGLLYPTQRDAEEQSEIAKLKSSISQLTAGKVYRYLEAQTETEGVLSSSRLEHLRKLFSRDDHSPWQRGRKKNRDLNVIDDTSLFNDGSEAVVIGDEDEEVELTQPKKSDDSPNGDGVKSDTKGGSQVEAHVEHGDTFSLCEGADTFEEMFGAVEDATVTNPEGTKWQDISKAMETEVGMFLGKAGFSAGTFLVNLSVTNRKQYDYRDFLQRFASRSEEMKVSPDEFDYIYYTFGLRKYKNMPLIEPLEYQESNRVRDFCIAIDTSGSCAGELVRMFIEKTYDVLRSSEGFGRKINVYIIQCDFDIRKIDKITSVRDIDDSFTDWQARGYGGTDFRPVFKYVDELVEKRELQNLKGLIYLTDGLGKYPDKPPDYETAFVFVNEMSAHNGAKRVPPWAMKVVMDEDDIIEL